MLQDGNIQYLEQMFPTTEQHLPPTTTNNVTVTPLGGIEGSNKFRKQSELQQLKLHNHKSRTSISIYDHVSSAGNHKSDYHPKNHRGYKRNGYYKYLYPVIGLLIASPVSAADVGGVSATANPIANSSGSVTNRLSRFT